MTEKKQKKKCPFNETLECEDCKFFQPYVGGEGKKICLFMQMIGERL